jgi:Sphingosine kinase and enzymes related to eukaryotic diacylglycerol kinase
MRYVFIVNPAAGKKNPYQTVFPMIQDYFRQQGIEFVCHVTGQPRQATELTRQQGAKGDAVRIFAVGGDGTLSEVAAGAVGLPNVEVGVIPCGSGNDYVKTFGRIESFLSPARQLQSASRWVDMIKSDGRLSINICSIGLDAKVGYEMNLFRNLPFLSGPAAYNLAVAKVLFGKLGDHLKITMDDGRIFEGNYLFALAGSGQYYGGGFRGAPLAVPDDGLLDFILVKKPPLLQIPRLVKIYRTGGHLGSPLFRDLVTFYRGKSMQVQTFGPVTANFDGECRPIHQVGFQVCAKAVRFMVPD